MKTRKIVVLTGDEISQEQYEEAVRTRSNLERTLSNANKGKGGCNFSLIFGGIFLLACTGLWIWSIIYSYRTYIAPAPTPKPKTEQIQNKPQNNEVEIFTTTPAAPEATTATPTPTPTPTPSPTPTIVQIIVPESPITLTVDLHDHLGEAYTTTDQIYQTLYGVDLPTDPINISLVAPPVSPTATPNKPYHQIYYNVKNEGTYPHIRGWIVDKNGNPYPTPIYLRFPTGVLQYPRPNMKNEKSTGYYEFLLTPGDYDVLVGPQWEYITSIHIDGTPQQIELSIQYNGEVAAKNSPIVSQTLNNLGSNNNFIPPNKTKNRVVYLPLIYK